MQRFQGGGGICRACKRGNFRKLQQRSLCDRGGGSGDYGKNHTVKMADLQDTGARERRGDEHGIIRN